MRIAYLVAGAGRMYCGACMRDNRIAAGLIRQGRDVVLVPLYTPIRTDETDVSERSVYYGALNVYLQQHAFFRRVPRFINRLLDSTPLLRGVGRLAARARTDGLGPLTVSVLAGENGAQRKELGKLIAGLKSLKPALINLPNLMFVGTARALKAELNVPILCTLAGEDAFLDALDPASRVRADELIRQGAESVDGFIAPTRYYASRAAERFGLARERVRYVPMGIGTDDLVPPPGPPGGPFTIGYLAGICPEKGLAELCEAFALLREQHPDCRLRVAGYAGAVGRQYWQTIRASLFDRGLDEAVDFVGEVNREEKVRFLHSLHVLSVPTVYPEPKGLYVLEAMACGVPVVQPAHGSFRELIEATGGGLLCEPGSPGALADKIAELKEDETLLARLSRQGPEGVRTSFTEEIMAERIWSVYQGYLRAETAVKNH